MIENGQRGLRLLSRTVRCRGSGQRRSPLGLSGGVMPHSRACFAFAGGSANSSFAASRKQAIATKIISGRSTSFDQISLVLAVPDVNRQTSPVTKRDRERPDAPAIIMSGARSAFVLFACPWDGFLSRPVLFDCAALDGAIKIPT